MKIAVTHDNGEIFQHFGKTECKFCSNGTPIPKSAVHSF